jgi:hypothetical protein
MSYFVHVATFLLLTVVLIVFISYYSFQCLNVSDVRSVVKQPINAIIIIITRCLLRTLIIGNVYTD